MHQVATCRFHACIYRRRSFYRIFNALVRSSSSSLSSLSECRYHCRHPQPVTDVIVCTDCQQSVTTMTPFQACKMPVHNPQPGLRSWGRLAIYGNTGCREMCRGWFPVSRLESLLIVQSTADQWSRSSKVLARVVVTTQVCTMKTAWRQADVETVHTGAVQMWFCRNWWLTHRWTSVIFVLIYFLVFVLVLVFQLFFRFSFVLVFIIFSF